MKKSLSTDTEREVLYQKLHDKLSSVFKELEKDGSITYGIPITSDWAYSLKMNYVPQLVREHLGCAEWDSWPSDKRKSFLYQLTEYQKHIIARESLLFISGYSNHLI